MKEFIDLLKKVKAECKSREQKVGKEIDFDDLCTKCKCHDECEALYIIGKELVDDTPQGFSINTIKKSIKGLGL